MDKDKVALFDKALDQLMGDMDDLEGRGAMAHSQEECPDPFGCKEHEEEASKPLSDEPSVKIEIHKGGMPTLDGVKDGEEGEGSEGLSEDEAEQLKKLLK